MFVVLRSCVVMKSRGPNFGETVGFPYLAQDLGGGHDGAWAQNEVRSLSSGFAQPRLAGQRKLERRGGGRWTARRIPIHDLRPCDTLKTHHENHYCPPYAGIYAPSRCTLLRTLSPLPSSKSRDPRLDFSAVLALLPAARAP